MMKNYRKILPIAMIFIMALSCYTLVSDSIKKEVQYDQYISEARRFADLNVTKYAIENYNNALALKSTPEIYAEVAQYYKNQENKETELTAWCERFVEEYPTEPLAYDCLLETYISQKDYTACFDILSVGDKRNVRSDFMDSAREELAYQFYLDFNTYDDVGIYSNNFCAVKSKSAWGYVDRFGNQRIYATLKTAQPFTKANVAPVINQKDEAYFIDKSGSKVMATKENYVSFGILSYDMIKVQLGDGRYSFLNKNLERALEGVYEDATAFNDGVAAVKTAGQWMLIDAGGKQLGTAKFSDIAVDEKNIAYRNDRLFVKNGSVFYMVDSNGKQVGSDTYEDARCYADNTYAAVKKDGQWYFVDKNGKRISDKTYEEARSFANGFAAVKIAGKWGFVDADENVVIEPQFFGAKEFNEKGSCFVMTGDKWQLLKLYSLNREG